MKDIDFVIGLGQRAANHRRRGNTNAAVASGAVVLTMDEREAQRVRALGGRALSARSGGAGWLGLREPVVVDLSTFADVLSSVEQAHERQQAELADTASDVRRLTAALAQESAESLRRLNERDEARLELRRLRAAEAPGTDDEAFEGTGWEAMKGDWWLWSSLEGVAVTRELSPDEMWEAWRQGVVLARSRFALDAMRAAAPGSV